MEPRKVDDHEFHQEWWAVGDPQPIRRYGDQIGQFGIKVLEDASIPKGLAIVVSDILDFDKSPVLVVGAGTLSERQKMMFEVNEILRDLAKSVLRPGPSDQDLQQIGFSSSEILQAWRGYAEDPGS